MLRLLAQRGATLLLRPAALLAEGFLLPNTHLLVFVLPAAAMALTMSSVPVYLEFLRTTDHHTNRQRIRQDYVSGLLAAIIIALCALLATLLVIQTSVSIIIIIIATFVTEKFADELTRFYEFKRRYTRWFFVQASRSAWLFIPIGLALRGEDYERSFCVLSVLAAIGIVTQFFLATKLRPILNANGWTLIRQNAPFLSSSALLACHRQLPRLMVAYLFPQLAHVFQAMGQLGQGVSLVFNVRYQIPHRKMIARRTLAFERLFRPTFTRIAALSLVISAFGVTISQIAPYSREAFFLTGLGITMLADALAFSLLATYLGLMPWFVAPSQALATLTIASCISAVIFASLYAALSFLGGSPILAPLATTLLSLVSAALIARRHLNRSYYVRYPAL